MRNSLKSQNAVVCIRNEEGKVLSYRVWDSTPGTQWGLDSHDVWLTCLSASDQIQVPQVWVYLENLGPHLHDL